MVRTKGDAIPKVDVDLLEVVRRAVDDLAGAPPRAAHKVRLPFPAGTAADVARRADARRVVHPAAPVDRRLVGAALVQAPVEGLAAVVRLVDVRSARVGRVVDDSIVVLENVYRHMQMGESKFDAALSATKEVAAAITSSTLATIVVFAPLAFIQGLVGSFFLPFCIAVSSALFASLIVSITFVPVVGAAILRPGDMVQDTEKTGNSLSFLQRIYKPALIWSLQHKIITIFF